MAVPKIKNVHPCGSRFLIELLTSQESTESTIIFTDNSKQNVFQAYILEAGPTVPEGFGVKKGDRVWVDGLITYAPEYGEPNQRKKGTIEYHMVRGIVEESGKK